MFFFSESRITENLILEETDEISDKIGIGSFNMNFRKKFSGFSGNNVTACLLVR